MSDTPVDRLHEEHRALVEFLSKQGEISFANDVDASFRKSLLLAAASYYEAWLRECLVDFVRERANDDLCVVSFVRNRGVERQFHTLFNWRERQANQFFGLFGAAFKSFMELAVGSNAKLGVGIAAFLELGDLRNNLVHQDFATFPLEKTVEEIYNLFLQAQEFRDELPRRLREYSSTAGSLAG